MEHTHPAGYDHRRRLPQVPIGSVQLHNHSSNLGPAHERGSRGIGHLPSVSCQAEGGLVLTSRP